MDALVAAVQWNRGLTIGLLCLVAAVTHVLAFGAGYWYLVRRNRQSGGHTPEHAGEQEHTRG
jgi:hypothetical protein